MDPQKTFKKNGVDLYERLVSTEDTRFKALNPKFLQWKSHIEDNLSDRGISGKNSRHNYYPEKELLCLCGDHAEKHGEFRNAKNYVILTHPFYFELSPPADYEIDDNLKSQSKRYMENLNFFLNLNREYSDTGILAFETLHHYAAATSILLEKGILDNVIFTEHDNGKALDDIYFSMFKDKQLFFCGGYNKRCLTDSINQVQNNLNGNAEFLGIKDLCLNPPEQCSLIPEDVKGINKNNLVGLDEAIIRLGLKNNL